MFLWVWYCNWPCTWPSFSTFGLCYTFGIDRVSPHAVGIADVLEILLPGSASTIFNGDAFFFDISFDLTLFKIWPCFWYFSISADDLSDFVTFKDEFREPLPADPDYLLDLLDSLDFKKVTDKVSWLLSIRRGALIADKSLFNSDGLRIIYILGFNSFDDIFWSPEPKAPYCWIKLALFCFILLRFELYGLFPLSEFFSWILGVREVWPCLEGYLVVEKSPLMPCLEFLT